MLPAAHRLTDPSAFAHTVRSGRRAGSPRLVVHLDLADPESRAAPRVGLVVSKAVGNAVVRNRVKRRLRHQCAGEIANLPAGAALVVRALPSSAEASSADLGQELHRLIGRCQGKVAVPASRDSTPTDSTQKDSTQKDSEGGR